MSERGEECMNLVGLVKMRCLFPLMVLAAMGCSGGLSKFPTETLIEYDPKTPTCAEYRITDFRNLKFEWVKDIPVAKCPAIFGFKASDIPKVNNWVRSAIRYGEECEGKQSPWNHNSMPAL